jgi:hypothetical protein
MGWRETNGEVTVLTADGLTRGMQPFLRDALQAVS